MTGTGQQMRAITGEVAGMFFERTDAVRVVAVAMLARQHSLLLGPPGTAKSEMARELTGRVDGAVYWEILLGKFTDPKKMFGPIDVPALMRGEYTQVLAGHATQAHIAFIDEIFKCSAGALNETLGYLNERLYHPEGGGTPIRCPLLSAVTASNELPAGDDNLAAIYDRLMVRLEVEYLADPSSFAALLRSGALPGTRPAARTTVDLGALAHAITSEVPAVAVPDGILDAMGQLRTALRRREMICSDRRWKQSVRLLQASAYLDDRPAVDDSDLDVLRHVLWDSTSERRAVAEEVLTLVNPDAREALNLLEAIDGLEQELDAKAGQSREHLAEWGSKEANSKLAAAGRRLDAMRAQAVSAGRSTATIDEVLARREAVYGRVLTEALGIDASMIPAARRP